MLKSKNKKGPVVLVSGDMSYSFPLSYGYLAGYLVERGEDVKILFWPEEKEKYPELIKEIIRLNPLLVGFGSLYPDLYPIKDIIKLLDAANRNFPIVIGGQMVSPTPEFALDVTGADIGIVGEGEITLFNLTNALRKEDDLSKVRGLVINIGFEKIITGPGEVIPDLSILPKIPYELFPPPEWLHVGRFFIAMPQPHNQYKDRSAVVHGGRGCPFKCNFCYHHSQTRYRPVESILEDAKELIKKYNANHLLFNDDLAIVSPDRARKLAQGMRALGKNIEYSLSARFDILERIDDDLLAELKNSGLRSLNIGVESGSQRILDIMNKKITVEQMKKGFTRLKKFGILPNANIMVGQITETNEDVQMSMNLMIDVLRENKNMNWSCTITTPFPGSELYDICFEKGIFKSHNDFFNLYKKYGMNGVTANLSNMTDEEIVDWLKKIRQNIKTERRRAIGRTIFWIEEYRIKADRFNSRLQKKIFSKFPQNIFVKTILKIYNFFYDLMQITFDETRLYLLDVKKRKNPITEIIKSVATVYDIYNILAKTRNQTLLNIKYLKYFFRRRLKKVLRKLFPAKTSRASTFVILAVKKPEYMQLAVNNINSLHYLNPNYNIKIWCDDICYKYYKKNKWRVDYPARIEVLNKFTDKNKPWQEFKIETIIESSLNDYILMDADAIWHDEPATDRDKIMFQVKAYNFLDNDAEKIMIENLFDKTWAKFDHYVTGFNSIPSKFMTKKLQSDLKNIYNKIFNSPLDFIKNENKRKEVKRISEEIAVNLAVQKHYSLEKIVPLKKTDTTKDNFSMQQLYYGCRTRNLE